MMRTDHANSLPPQSARMQQPWQHAQGHHYLHSDCSAADPGGEVRAQRLQTFSYDLQMKQELDGEKDKSRVLDSEVEEKKGKIEPYQPLSPNWPR